MADEGTGASGQPEDPALAALREGGQGIWLGPCTGDLKGFVAAIEELSQQPERCAEMGRNGRQFILENLTREVGTRKYVEVIKSVANR